MLQSRNPATGKVVGEYVETSIETLNRCIEAARQAFYQWSILSFEQQRTFRPICIAIKNAQATTR